MSSTDCAKLLISVRDQVEADDALVGGADWIDLKEPSAGPLGAVSAATAQNIVRAIRGCCPLSAAMGELIDWPISPAGEILEVPGISVVKLGLKDCGMVSNWRRLWRQSFHECLNTRKHLAAVVYADWREARSPAPDDVLELAIQVGCRYLLIDTCDKISGSSITHLSWEELSRIVNAARRQGMMTVLAGNLQAADFTQITELSIQMVAVRGAACRVDRTSRIDRIRVSELQHRLSEAYVSAKELRKRLTSVI